MRSSAPLRPLFLGLLLLLLSLGESQVASAAASCQDGWTPNLGHCYHITESGMNWESAREYCGSRGAYLIEITSEDEQASLLSFVPQDLQYWIGLTDEVEEGKWVWQDSFLVADYTHWASGQPDGGTGDNCAIFDYSGQFWWDIPCSVSDWNSRQIHGVCEMDEYAN